MMQRREFVKSALMLGGALACKEGSAFSLQASGALPVVDPQVKRVLTVFKCHFDVGFVNTQAAVVSRYFDEYFPQAIRVADAMRQAGTQRYVWTTGSWLLYEYLEQATTEDRRRMERAISAGDIAWHALPFNWQTELMDRSMICGSIALSHALDRRFGRTTTGAKLTDVPGHTRGLIGAVAAEGVTFLDIGVNGASMPAEVPPLFVWKDSSGTTLVVMYHHDYGGIVRVPGSDVAVAIVVRGDNSGPHKAEEVTKIYSDLKGQFPNAQVIPGSLTDIANAVESYRSHLPVVSQEIGDTWIYGVSSDPLKLARYREVARLRQSWIAQRKFHAGDATDVSLLRHLLLEAEHTWGTDTKTWLDFDHYTPLDLKKMLHTSNYEVVQASWAEKRQDLFAGITTLPAPLRDEALASLRGLEAKEPQIGHLATAPVGKEIETAHFLVALDPGTGAIHRLYNKKTNLEWASADHPLGLFSYQTLSEQDYSRFFSNYVISSADWAKKDFGKPNIERFGAESREWLPSVAKLHVEEDEQGHRLLAHLEIHDAEALQSGRAAFPQKIYLELLFPKAEPVIHMNLSWLEKAATRLPEAMWLSFNPIVSAQHWSWTIDKSGEEISLFEIVAGGSRHLHAVSRGFRYSDGGQSLFVETLDAPVIALGDKSPLNFSKSQPDLSGGVHCNLFNNAWGTNYIMWFGEDMRFRFLLHA
jgi:hypothetical protein